MGIKKAPQAASQSKIHIPIKKRPQSLPSVNKKLPSLKKPLKEQSSHLTFSDDILFRLPNAQYFPAKTINVRQNLRFEYQKQAESFQAVLTYGPKGLNIVLLNNLGIRGLTAHWDGKNYTEKRHKKLPEKINGRYILFDIFTIFGSDDLLNASLICDGRKPCVRKIKKPSSVDMVDQNNTRLRRYQFDLKSDNLWDSQIDYRNISMDYRLNIQSHRF